VSYKISNTALSVPWFERIVADTLDLHLRGEDLRNSPLSKAGRKLAWKNRWHWTLFNPRTPEDLEEGLVERVKTLIGLYHSIKDYGYNGSIIAAWFDKDGRVHLYDGFHRIAVMKYLGMDELVNVETIWSKKDYDFPLRDTLETLPRVGKCTYQPVLDDRVKDFPVDRQDSPERLDYILKNLVGETVLDIGCSEGYFSMELAKRGYRVTATDTDPGKMAVTRYLSTINDADVECHNCEGEKFLAESTGYDNVLYLSVFHNTIYDYGAAKAVMALRKLRGKAKRVFFEVPNGETEQQWKDVSGGAPLYFFKGKDFEHTINDATGMKVLELHSGFRPMYLLAEDKKQSKMHILKPIPNEEWEKHQTWEKGWWRNVSNTYSEQVLQEMYAGYMKLAQYAGKTRAYTFDLQGKSVIDIGGGPVSLLLRCENFSKAVVVDPCDYPKWVADRYKGADIDYVKLAAEDITYDKEFDEAWIYNVLQHVRDPRKIVKNAIRAAKKIRVFEPLEIGVFPGHPHNLCEDALNEAFERQGIVHMGNGKAGQIYYYGVFIYG